MECARRLRLSRASALMAFVLAAFPACDGSKVKNSGNAPEEPLPVFAAEVRVVSEDGTPITNATYRVDAAPQTSPVDASGRFRLQDLAGPVLVVVEAPGHLPEPIVLDAAVAAVPGGTEVRLFRRAGPGGRRRI